MPALGDRAQRAELAGEVERAQEVDIELTMDRII